MRIITLISIILTFSAFENSNEITETVVEEQAIVDEFDLPESQYVVLPFDTTWYWIFKEVKQAELSKSELTKVEEIIEIAVNENNERQKNKLIKHNETNPDNQRIKTGFELKLKGCKRQYVPLINKKKKKEIWINFFCDDWGSKNWKSDIFMVNDGGNCYFNLKVNLTTKTYSELRINGYA